MLCPEDQEFHPLSNCECGSSQKIKDELYPEWASDLDIQFARDAGMDRFWPKTIEEPLITCAAYMRCTSGFYVNELACKCFSLAQCFAPCPVGWFDMPTEDCGCTEDYYEYLALFPESATQNEIDISRGF